MHTPSRLLRHTSAPARPQSVWLGLLLVVVAVTAVLVLLRPLLVPHEAQAALGLAATAQATPSVTASPPAQAGLAPSGASDREGQEEPVASPQPSVPPVARTDEMGIAHSDTTGDGTWRVAVALPAPSTPRSSTHRYLLQVEGGTGIDADEIAPFVNAVLNDDRGWAGVDDVSFEQVQDPAQADFTLNVATPGTTDQLCAPLSTEGRWSCRQGATVNLNADRWSYLVPWFPDAETYRSYLVNHEVGHWLGRGHLRCPGEGLKAPTMMQQSGGLERCLANPWPTQDGQAG
nr:DUF3152 domain-containing protein [Actinomyces sp.]